MLAILVCPVAVFNAVVKHCQNAFTSYMSRSRGVNLVELLRYA